MVRRTTIRHDDVSVKEDLKHFFTNPDHRVYQRGTQANCGPDWPYYKTQLAVLFENDHFHWVTARAIDSLLEEGFLKSQVVVVGSIRAIFVWRHGVRSIKRRLNQLAKILEQDASPAINRMVGKHAETIFKWGFRSLGFSIVSEDADSYQGRHWTRTGHDLDFIAQKDSLAYGVEIKNTFDYMDMEELEIKLDMCDYLGLIPFFICRHRAKSHLEKVQEHNGQLYIFGSKLFPLGQEQTTQQIWRFTRLPVKVSPEAPSTFESVLMNFHQQQVDNLS